MSRCNEFVCYCRVKVLDMMSMPVQIVGDLGYYTVSASDEITTLSGVKLKNIVHELVCDRRQLFSCLPELLNDAASASSVNRKRSTIATEMPADPAAVTKKRAKHDARLSSRSDELDVATLQLSSLSDDDEGCHDAVSRGGEGARAASFSSSLSLRKASRRFSKKRYCGGSAGEYVRNNVNTFLAVYTMREKVSRGSTFMYFVYVLSLYKNRFYTRFAFASNLDLRGLSVCQVEILLS
jgi:hypothetical protein